MLRLHPNLAPWRKATSGRWKVTSSRLYQIRTVFLPLSTCVIGVRPHAALTVTEGQDIHSPPNPESLKSKSLHQSAAPPRPMSSRLGTRLTPPMSCRWAHFSNVCHDVMCYDLQTWRSQQQPCGKRFSLQQSGGETWLWELLIVCAVSSGLGCEQPIISLHLLRVGQRQSCLCPHQAFLREQLTRHQREWLNVKVIRGVHNNIR